MKIQFLESSKQGLVWMKNYYKNNPQLHHKKASSNFLNAQSLLLENPYLGQKYENFNDIRELKISQSHFSILYTHRNETIYVIDIRDHRGLRSAIALNEFNSSLRKKYDL